MDQEPLPAPPTVQPQLDLDDQPRSSWPKVLGVLSLIYALGGLACQVGGASYLSLFNMLPDMFRGGMEIPGVVRVTGVAQALAGFVIGLIMLFGAINLLRRRRSGPSLLRKWVVWRLVLVLVGLGLAIPLLPAQVQMARQSERYMEKMKQENPGMMTFGDSSGLTDEQLARASYRNGVIGTAVFAAYPIFLGFWLTRRRIEDEIATWPE